MGDLLVAGLFILILAMFPREVEGCLNLFFNVLLTGLMMFFFARYILPLWIMGIVLGALPVARRRGR